MTLKIRETLVWIKSTKINVDALAFQINQSHNVGIVRSKQVCFKIMKSQER